MSKKPNVVAILIDDMGWKDLSYCGSDFYESPNIDKLKEQGMYFSRAYAACPVCSPSRASFLTGKYPATVGVTNWIAYGGAHPRYGKLIDAPYIDHMPLEETTLAHAFKDSLLEYQAAKNRIAVQIDDPIAFEYLSAALEAGGVFRDRDVKKGHIAVPVDRFGVLLRTAFPAIEESEIEARFKRVVPEFAEEPVEDGKGFFARLSDWLQRAEPYVNIAGNLATCVYPLLGM